MPKKVAAANNKKSKIEVEGDSSEEEEVIKPVTTKKVKLNNGSASKTPVNGDNKAKSKKQAKAAQSDSDESDESEEVVANKKKNATKPVGTSVANKKVQKKIMEEESDDSEEAAPPAKNKAKGKAAATKKAVQASESDDDDSDEAATKKPVKTAKKAVKKQDSDDEEEEKAAPAHKKGGKASASGDGTTYEAYVTGISFQASENDIKQHFAECGNIDSVNLLKGFDGRSKGIAFVRFTSEDSLTSALEYEGSELSGRTIHVEKSTPKGQRAPKGGDAGGYGGGGDNGASFSQKPRTAQDPSSSTVFIGNLSFNSTEDSIRSHFSACGSIANIRIATDRDTGRMRGFGHIDFESPDSCAGAVALAGTNLDGRPINVDFAGGKKGGAGGGGFGGGRGGGFGGGRGGGFGGGRGGGFGGGRGGRGGGMLSEDDRNAKKGSIASFQGQKKRL